MLAQIFNPFRRTSLGKEHPALLPTGKLIHWTNLHWSFIVSVIAENGKIIQYFLVGIS